MRTLIDNVTATGVGPGQYLVESKPNHVFSEHAVQIMVDPGAAGITVDLEGSLDGQTWFQIVQHIMTPGERVVGSALFFTNLSPVEYVRANVVANTGSDSVTVLYSGIKGGG